VPGIVRSIAIHPPPRLPDAPFATNGDKVHKSVVLVYLAWLCSLEGEPTHPWLHDVGSSQDKHALLLIGVPVAPTHGVLLLQLRGAISNFQR
jgi:hypothetical protein